LRGAQPVCPTTDPVCLLTSALMGFFLISRCTRRAHVAFYPIEKLTLSVQSIMGAVENFQRKPFILLIYFAPNRSAR
jgi:hypothetical protein